MHMENFNTIFLKKTLENILCKQTSKQILICYKILKSQIFSEF